MRHSKIHREIMREYEFSRNRADSILAKHQANAYEKIPRLAEIDSSLGTLGISLAKMALSGDAEGMKATRTAAAVLKNERNNLLKQKGWDEGYFVPQYRCTNCSDTGYIQETPSSLAVMCQCLKQRLIDEYYNLSNMNEVLRDENFDTFDIRLFSTEVVAAEGLSPRANIENVHRHATKFVQEFGRGFVNLLLYGETGLGKTFICHCIAHDLLAEGRTVLYLTVPRLCRFIEDYRFNRDSLEEPNEMLDAMDEADLLILDDLGTEISTVVTSAALFDIINQRLITRKPTIISTNLASNDLKSHYSERIVSRFLGNYQMIKFFGDDIRTKKKYAGVRI